MMANVLQISNFTANSARNRTCPSVEIGYLGSEWDVNCTLYTIRTNITKVSFCR